MMMPRSICAALFCIISFDASAIVRYMVQDMTCSQVRDALDRDGAAILYRHGTGGILLYDRFVKDPSFCSVGYTPSWERIAVADADDCRVRKCIQIDRFGR